MASIFATKKATGLYMPPSFRCVNLETWGEPHITPESLRNDLEVASKN